MSLKKILRPQLFVLSPVPLLLSAIAISCGDSGDGGPAGVEPKIVTFTANGSETNVRVDRGQIVTLAWKVEGAQTVGITTPDLALIENDTRLEGSVVSAAITAETIFTLEATGAEGTTPATKAITVSVNDAGNVQIRSFMATPPSIELNASSSLSWDTVNATAVTIAEMGGATIPTMGMLSGQTSVSPAVTTTYVITAEGPGGPVTDTETVTVNGSPSIDDFSAAPTIINLGQTSTLSWMVTNTDSIRISDGSTDIHNSQAQSGGFAVSPAMTTTYTLSALRGMFAPATRALTVTVNTPQGAQIVSFAAAPPTITAGQTSVLSWQVQNAPQGIEIQAGGNTITTSSAQTGNTPVMPGVTTTYTLIARNTVGGNNMATVTVTVNVGPPVITSFTAAPNPAAIGGTSVLTWNTTGATSVRVLEGALGLPLFGQVQSGSIVVTSTVPSTSYVLVATSGLGMDTASVSISWGDLATIDAFDVTPLNFTGASTVAAISWATTGATRVELRANGTPVAGFPMATLSGNFSTTISATTRFELSAITTFGAATAARTVVLVQDLKSEPNDDIGSADPIPGNGNGVSGTLADVNDSDFYSVTVSAGGWIRAETSEPGGGCPLHDTVLTLYDSAGVGLITDLDDGVGFCSLIDPRIDFEAANLAAGTYYLAVESEFGGVGPYVLIVETGAPGCGNSILETQEQCDDGNLQNGDGCSSSCQIQPLGAVTAADIGMTRIFNATVQAGVEVFYQITLPGAGYIRAETFSPASPVCDVDTLVRLLDSTGAALGQNDDGGVFLCSLIDPTVDLFARRAAGAYLLGVRHFESGPTPIAVHIRTSGQGCGNGFVEVNPPLSETCDDGNGTPGDGCDGSCQIEGLSETEPNNIITDIGIITLTGTQALFSGAINPLADVDLWEVDVPAGYALEAFVTIGAPDTCPTVGPSGALTLRDAGGTELVTDSTGGVDGHCGFIGPRRYAVARNMAQGVYYLEVGELNDDDTIPGYFLSVRLLEPGCGNQLIETGEICDDGNLINNDGCSSTCQIEITATINFPGGSATINVPGENTFGGVQVNVAAGQSIDVTASDGAGGCPVASAVLEIYRVYAAGAGYTFVTDSASGGPAGCPRIEFPFESRAGNLAAGSYYVRVINTTPASAQIQLDLIVANAVCGNGVLEYRAGETCDDLNTTAGDGCATNCTVEVALSYNIPGNGPMTFTGRSLVPDQRDIVQINVAAPGPHYLLANVYEDAATMSCTVIDGLMSLATAIGEQIGSDSGFSAPYCPVFDQTSGFNLLVPGTYYLYFGEFFGGAVAAYDLVLNHAPGATCGNGTVELLGAETCDDSNTVGGDGCSAACRIEGQIYIPEVEPNDTNPTATNTTLVGTGTVTMIAHIGLFDDVDYFRIQVPVGQTRMLRARTHLDPTDPSAPCPADPFTFEAELDTEIALFDGAGVEISGARQDDIMFPDNVCSQIQRTLTAGTYYVTVEYSSFYTGNPPGAQPYLLRISLE